jgi:hypothetical protein
MKITDETIREFLCSHANHITHWAVAHTHFHTYHATNAEVLSMKTAAQKQVRYFLRTFNQYLYQSKAHRKPQLYTPLVITTIEFAKASPFKQDTMHFNFALGNIPKNLTTEELRKIFEHCWVDKAKLSSKALWLKDAVQAENTNWLNYITKEAETGNIETWDFENTQIPHLALTADIS